MNPVPTIPTAELVREAVLRFDQEFPITEKALRDLFAQYPLNSDPSHVLLKVACLNRLYNTAILAVWDMAAHIHALAPEIDTALPIGDPEIVGKIAHLELRGRTFTFYSFATKYCSWHRPELFPLFDSRVVQYLTALKKHRLFESDEFCTQNDLWHYPTFVAIMNSFRTEFGLGDFSYKDIDKFLWLHGTELNEMTKRRDLQDYLNMIPTAPPDPGDELPSDLQS